MANKKPLVHYSGNVKELQTSDKVAATDIGTDANNRFVTDVNIDNWNDAYNLAIGTRRIVVGNATWSGTGLTFDVTDGIFYINGIRYTSIGGQATAAASDPALPRIDVIYYDTSGSFGIITGTPAASPSKPVVDYDTQIEITSINIAAAAIIPVITGNLTIYNENIEFTGTSNNGTVNFANTILPAVGTKHVSCGAFTNNQYIYFNDVTLHNSTTFQYLKYRHKLNATFSANTYFTFYFANGTNPVSNQVSVTTGNFGFVRTATALYQIIVIPISAFVFTNPNFNRIYITFKGSNATGFYLDMLELQGGITIPPTNGVQSFNTRTGNVIPQSGDYTAQMVNAIPSSYLDVDGTLTANSDLKVSTQKAVKTYIDTGLATKQNSLGFTPENVVNKSTSTGLGISNTLYPTQNAVKSYVDALANPTKVYGYYNFF